VSEEMEICSDEGLVRKRSRKRRRVTHQVSTKIVAQLVVDRNVELDYHDDEEEEDEEKEEGAPEEEELEEEEKEIDEENPVVTYTPHESVTAKQFLLVKGHPFKRGLQGVSVEEMLLEFGLVQVVAAASKEEVITVSYYKSNKGNIGGVWNVARNSSGGSWTGELNRNSILSYRAGLTSQKKLNAGINSVLVTHPGMKNAYAKVNLGLNKGFGIQRTAEGERVAALGLKGYKEWQASGLPPQDTSSSEAAVE
jgi:hypothetical protein